MVSESIADYVTMPSASLAGVKSMEELDRPGEHLWVFVGAVAVADPERPLAGAVLGGDLAGPGCFKCELVYSRKLARQPCTGVIS